MKRFLAVASLLFLVPALAVTPASAKKSYSKVKGQVVKVEQHVKTANGGEYDRLTIRTRNGEQMQLHLGESGACQGCYQQGDSIRARIRADDGAGGPRAVQSMKVRRDGKMYGYVNADGKMVQAGDRGRAGGSNGGGDRLRDRTHEPGSGACPGCAGGQRGGGQASGGGRGSGGGGGGGRGGGGGGN